MRKGALPLSYWRNVGYKPPDKQTTPAALPGLFKTVPSLDDCYRK